MGLELDRMKTKIKFDKTKEDEIKICRAPNMFDFYVQLYVYFIVNMQNRLCRLTPLNTV